MHKLRICLIEWKECKTALKIIIKKQLIQPFERLQDIFQETEELIAIIAKSIETAKIKKLKDEN
ncbi:MAG TPA: four helix bundle protein [Flavisolibacter sp.]